MENIELLIKEKALLLKELKAVQVPSRKEEIIDRILEIEQIISKLTWVFGHGSVSAVLS